MVSDGCASTEILVLLWVQVAGLSVSDLVTAVMRMLAAAALFLGMSTSHDRQSAALLQEPDINLKVILYVANSSDQ